MGFIDENMNAGQSKPMTLVRIYATVTDASNNIIGYMLLDEKTGQTKSCSINDVKIMLRQRSFTNADLDGDNIVNTECSMNRLPELKYGKTFSKNAGITVLAETSDGKYVAVDQNIRMATLIDKDLIDMNKRGVYLVNVKIVTKDGKTHISAIKKPFRVIQVPEKAKPKLNRVEVKPKDSKEKLWIKARHTKKIVNSLKRNLLFYLNGKANSGVWNCMASLRVYRKTGESYVSFIDVNKKFSIVSTDLVRLTKADEDTINTINLINNQVVKFGLKEMALDTYNEDANTIVKVNTLWAYAAGVMMCNDELRDQVMSYLSRNVRSDRSTLRRIKEMTDSKLCSKKLRQCLMQLGYDLKNRVQRMDANEQKQKEIFAAKEYKITNFDSGKAVATLGLAINPSNEGYDMNGVKLNYIGKYIEGAGLAEKYKSASSCFGDFCCIADIEKRIHSDMNTRYSKLMTAGALLTMLYTYNPTLAEMYITDHAETDSSDYEFLARYVGSIRDMYDEDALNLSEPLRLYYNSGFNVYYNDNFNHRNYIRESELINYRRLGAKYIIQHDDMEEIASLLVKVHVDFKELGERHCTVLAGSLRMI